VSDDESTIQFAAGILRESLDSALSVVRTLVCLAFIMFGGFILVGRKHRGNRVSVLLNNFLRWEWNEWRVQK
jgi:hypothetical protein